MEKKKKKIYIYHKNIFIKCFLINIDFIFFNILDC